jgi:hypothetical protein
LPKDIRNLNDALEVIDGLAMHTSQGSFVKVSDLRKLFEEKREVLEAELEDRIERRIPYRMTPEKARRLAMRDEKLREDFPAQPPREPGKSVPAGPTANEGVKS